MEKQKKHETFFCILDKYLDLTNFLKVVQADETWQYFKKNKSWTFGFFRSRRKCNIFVFREMWKVPEKTKIPISLISLVFGQLRDRLKKVRCTPNWVITVAQGNLASRSIGKRAIYTNKPPSMKFPRTLNCGIDILSQFAMGLRLGRAARVFYPESNPHNAVARRDEAVTSKHLNGNSILKLPENHKSEMVLQRILRYKSTIIALGSILSSSIFLCSQRKVSISKKTSNFSYKIFLSFFVFVRNESRFGANTK